MFFLLQILPTDAQEPLLRSGLVLGGGATVIWFANRINRIYDWTRDMRHSLYGSPDSKQPRGLIADVERHEREIEAAKLRTTTWVAGLNALDDRVEAVEQTCRQIHRKNVNGDDI